MGPHPRLGDLATKLTARVVGATVAVVQAACLLTMNPLSLGRLTRNAAPQLSIRAVA